MSNVQASTHRGKSPALGTVAAVLLLAGVALFLITGRQWRSSTSPSTPHGIRTLSDLLLVPAEQLSQVDIGRMDLLCAQGLPGAEDLDMDRCLETLDQMAERVRSETSRHRYSYERNPAEFEHSEGYYQMLFLAVVLAEDFKATYVPDKRGTAADARPGDGFFADAHDIFLHGLLGGRRQGTCSSLPVLQIAVGRRLGYPLKLVTTKGHLFLRWEDARERFNIEAAGQGVNRFSDEYYRHWPVETSDQDVAAEGYLQSLSAAEELAAMLSIRAACLREASRAADARAAFAAAAALAPGCQTYRYMAQVMSPTTSRPQARQSADPKP